MSTLEVDSGAGKSLGSSGVVTEAFVVAKRAELVSDNTVRVYRWALNHLPPEPWTTTVIQQAYVDYGGRMAGQSICNLDQVWRTFFAWLEGFNGHVNPMAKVKKPRRPRQLVRIFSDLELVNICKACEIPRDRALVALLIGTGLRLAEVSALTWRDFDGGRVTVQRGKGQKGRTVFMDTVSKLPFAERQTLPEVLAALRVTMPRDKWDHGFLSLWQGPSGPIGYKAVTASISRIVANAGISGKKRGAHTFRHTYATMYLRAGGSLWALQQQLGHSDIETTMGYPKLVARDIESDVNKTKMLAVINV